MTAADPTDIVDADIHNWLARSSAPWLAETTPPGDVVLKRESTVRVATLQFGKRSRTLVVKQLMRSDPVACPRSLCRIHERVRGQGESLEQGTPRFYGGDATLGVLAMQCINGTPLETRLERAARHDDRASAMHSRLFEAAELLASMNTLDAADVGLSDEPRRNGDYVASFLVTWKHPRIRALLPLACHDPQCVLSRLSPAFFEREENRVLVGDPQPKNVLIRDDGTPCLIDLNYCRGNAAIDLAQFLVSLDRMGLKHPFPRRQRRFAAWKAAFLQSYVEHGPPHVAEDIIFFVIVYRPKTDIGRFRRRRVDCSALWTRAWNR